MVMPADDAGRAARHFGGDAAGVDEATDILGHMSSAPHTATVGFGALPHRLAGSITARLGEDARSFDDAFYAATSPKLHEEITAASRATAIAEAGYEHMKALIRPGLRECDLAVAVNLFMKAQGADDSFLMLNAGPRADAVMPSSERPLEEGDLILVELSPSVEGQFVQICRTVAIGEPAPEIAPGYELLVQAMRAGISKVKPGVRMGEICGAIDDLLSEAGFAQYSRPPFIRRRGHGLGAGSTHPGDVAVDNDTALEAGMVFIVHPNQFLPTTGYMMCGEPLVVGEAGPLVLSSREARLDVVTP
jgi:Xaa-Pro aminopeptidase